MRPLTPAPLGLGSMPCRIGFGAMHLSDPGARGGPQPRPDRDAAIEMIHAALDAGVRLVDTADAYAADASEVGHNERLVADAVRSWRRPEPVQGGPDGDALDAEVIVATKGGHVRDGAGRWDVDGRPEHLVAAALASRDRLRVPSIRLYQLHRPDPKVPWGDSVAALATLRREGVVDHVGLSNVTLSQLEEAAGIVTIAAVQNELSPFELGSLDVLRWCRRHEVPFLAWAPLGGIARVASLGSDPKVAAFGRVAARHGVSVVRVVLAWLLTLSPEVVPIPGSTRVASVLDSVAACRSALDPDDLDALDRATGRAT